MEEPQLGVSLRPNDPFANKLASNGVDSRNVLVKVTLPKRTGRKRKRGTNDAFAWSDEPTKHNESITAPELLQRIQENPEKTSIEAVGMIHETHRFRSLPDFQITASNHPTMRELRTHAMKPHYDSLKNFNVDMTPGAAHINDFIAPPSFIGTTQPYRFEYQQAQGVRFAEDARTGEMTASNSNKALRRIALSLPPDAEEVPTGPPPSLERYSAHGQFVDRCIADLRILLEKRPLVTRRVAMNHLPSYSDTIFKEATQWVGYSFSAGPWRDTLIKYGVDPRKDPKYRFYQTLMFQLDKRYVNAYASTADPGPAVPRAAVSNYNRIRGGGNTGGEAAGGGSKWNRSVRHIPDSEESHIFNGQCATLNGKTWQILDITDPLLSSILHTDGIRAECDPFYFGWYHNGTLCKARVIMRDKMERLFTGLQPRREDWERIKGMPEIFTAEDSGGLGKEFLVEGSRKMANDVKGMARSAMKNEELRAREEKARRAVARVEGRSGGRVGEVEPALLGERDGEAGADEVRGGDVDNGMDAVDSAAGADAEGDMDGNADAATGDDVDVDAAAGADAEPSADGDTAADNEPTTAAGDGTTV